MRQWRLVGLVLGLVFVWVLTGCKPAYQVEYKLRRSFYPDKEILNVKVAGKAADLAVILTDLEGEVIETNFIEKKELIDNVEDVEFYVKRGEIYTLLIKTIDPERVVQKEKLEF